jgi:hypothetical protein
LVRKLPAAIVPLDGERYIAAFERALPEALEEMR